METPKPRRIWFAGIALGVLFALFLWPATRSLIGTQFALALGRPAGAIWPGYLADTSADAERALRAVANRHPDDYPIQLAQAIREADALPDRSASRWEGYMQRLHALTPKFPDSPSLYANLLRLATRGAVRLNRPEEEAQVTDDPNLRNVRNAARSSAAALAQFDQDAAAGERLDPENAYFPFMRAVGLFAAHRDADAIAALRRAADRPRWEEYYGDEVEGEWRMQEEAFGDHGVLPRVASSAMILFPQYAQFRGAGRVAMAKAIEAEQEGAAEGVAIRHAVMECGSRMRVQARPLIGAMVGVALTRVALLRPGGVPLIPEEKPAVDRRSSVPFNLVHQKEMADRRRLHAYENYLRRVDHADAIAWVDAEFAAGSRARALTKRAVVFSPFSAPLWKLVFAWAVCMIVLSGALWMLALAGASSLLARSSRIRDGRALPGCAQRGLAFGLTVGTLGVIAALFSQKALWAPCLLTSMAAGLFVLLLPGLSRADRLRSLGVFTLGLLGVFLLTGALVWQINNSIGPCVRMALLLNQHEGEGPQGDLRVVMMALSACLVLGVPFLTLLTLSVISRACRVPLSVGLIRGLRGCALPIACLLFLAYGVLVPLTQRQERVLDEGLTGTLHHEGSYLVGLIGETWPGEAR
jgi:hypothetical protein